MTIISSVLMFLVLASGNGCLSFDDDKPDSTKRTRSDDSKSNNSKSNNSKSNNSKNNNSKNNQPIPEEDLADVLQRIEDVLAGKLDVDTWAASAKQACTTERLAWADAAEKARVNKAANAAIDCATEIVKHNLFVKKHISGEDKYGGHTSIHVIRLSGKCLVENYTNVFPEWPVFQSNHQSIQDHLDMTQKNVGANIIRRDGQLLVVVALSLYPDGKDTRWKDWRKDHKEELLALKLANKARHVSLDNTDTNKAWCDKLCRICVTLVEAFTASYKYRAADCPHLLSN